MDTEPKIDHDHEEDKSEDSGDVVKEALKKGILLINAPITDASIFTIYQPLQNLIEERSKLKTPDPIQVVINSPGGAAFVGLALAKMMAASPVPITTKVFGFAASAAAIIFLGGHKRIVTPGSRLMFHDSWTFNFGATGEHSKRLADMHEELDREIVEWIVERTGMPREFVEIECSKDHWYLTSAQALQWRFSTE